MRSLIIINAFGLLICSWLFAARAGASVDDYLHDFERRSDLEAWRPYDESAGCTLANPGSGGNPGGYLQIRCGGQFVGAWTRSPDFTGNLNASTWALGFDVANFSTAQRADLIDIMVFGQETAWIYYGTLESAAAGAWTSYGLTINPAWSDDEARANHWAPETATGGTAASWASVMKQVDAIGFRARISADADASAVQLGIDNVRLGSL